MAIPDAERRFGPDKTLIARLEDLDERFPGQVTLLPEGMAVFGTAPLTIQQTRFGEGVTPMLLANDAANLVGIIREPKVVRTLIDDSEILPNGKTMAVAIEDGFDGVLSIPTRRGRYQRPYELLLPTSLGIDRHEYELISSTQDHSTLEEVAQRTRDFWSDAMPIDRVHYGKFKVRRNWLGQIIADLDCMKAGLYDGNLDDALREEIDDFITRYSRRDLATVMTSMSDVQAGNNLLTRIIERR